MRARRPRTRLSAVFLDRDGVINRKAPEGEYITSWEGFSFLPGALDGITRLAASPLAIVVATNQRGIALGRMSEDDLAQIHRKMLDAIRGSGGRIDAIYHCPHEVGCFCRKPEIGMFETAARELALRLSETAVIGDSPSDMLAARRIGARGILVERAGVDRAKLGARSRPAWDVDYVAKDLYDAAGWLVSQ